MEKMMDGIIKLYGFENDNTITFCEMCESGIFTEEEIKKEFEYLLKNA